LKEKQKKRKRENSSLTALLSSPKQGQQKQPHFSTPSAPITKLLILLPNQWSKPTPRQRHPLQSWTSLWDLGQAPSRGQTSAPPPGAKALADCISLPFNPVPAFLQLAAWLALWEGRRDNGRACCCPARGRCEPRKKQAALVSCCSSSRSEGPAQTDAVAPSLALLKEIFSHFFVADHGP
jgi:hypothetical protein